MAESYLPFLAAARRLAADGVPLKATVGLTPVLCEQLRDPRFPASFRRYAAHRVAAARRDLGASDGPPAGLALHWIAFYEEARRAFDALGGDLLSGFAALEEKGAIELISSAATHGFLPLLPTDAAISRQLDVGLACHERHFGRRPRGLWLPECAYRPAGPWLSPADGRSEERRGIADFLVERGIGHTFVETHLVTGRRSSHAYGASDGLHAGPAGAEGASGEARGEEADGAGARDPASGTGRSPHRVWSVTAAGGSLAVLARDPATSERVWSGMVGYPGDPWYLEFHRKHAPGGLRYWRVTDSGGPLDGKEPWDPARAAERVAAHAAHFVSLVEEVAAEEERPAVVAAMFDFELFGHWWFEGVAFLEAVFRRLASGARDVVPATSAEAVVAAGEPEPIDLPAGSWGRGGDFRVWSSGATVPYWREVERGERRLAEVLALDPELAPAAARQLLLLQASDWPFLVENGSAADYAQRRIARHAGALATLAALARRRGRRTPSDGRQLARLARRDRLFAPELEAPGLT